MICQGVDAVHAQGLRQLLHLFAAEAVDDAGLAFLASDEFDDLLVDVVPFRLYFIVEVRAVERRFEHSRIRDAKALLYVVLHLRGGCRCQCDDGDLLSYLVDYRADSSIFRPEVMSPFRDAMRLVYGEEGNLHLSEEFHVLFLG